MVSVAPVSLNQAGNSAAPVCHRKGYPGHGCGRRALIVAKLRPTTLPGGLCGGRLRQRSSRMAPRVPAMARGCMTREHMLRTETERAVRGPT